MFIIEITNKELREEQRHTKVVVPQELVDNLLGLYHYLPTARHRIVEGTVDRSEAITGDNCRETVNEKRWVTKTPLLGDRP